MAVTLDIIAGEIRRKKYVTWFLLDNESLDKRFLPLSTRLRSSKIRKLVNDLCSENLEFAKNLQVIESIDVANYSAKKSKQAKKVARSEIISRLRESNPCESHNFKTLEFYSKKYIDLYQFFYKYLLKNTFAKAYIFNGRPLCERAFSDAALKRGLKLEYFETFNENWSDRYFLFKKSIHLPKYRSEIMLDFAQRARARNLHFFTKTSTQWFESRLAGTSQSYTKKQNSSKALPVKKPFYVFFNSSQDEIDMVGLQDKYWGNQINILKTLVSIFRNQSQYQFVLRVHPHLKYKSKRDKSLWFKIGNKLQKKYSWFTYIGPGDPISSYKLIQESAGVITSGSTIGVEAVYLKKMSILLGNAFHKPMGVTINPKNKTQLIDVISEPNRFKNSVNFFSAALAYGFFHAHGGQKFKFVQQENNNFYSLYSFKISYPFLIRFIRKIELKVAIIFLKLRSTFKCRCIDQLSAHID